MTEIQRLAKQAVEKQAFAGAVGAGIGGLVGAANLPEDASVAERARYGAQGALRGAGLGSGLQAGSGLGMLGSMALMKGQKDPSTLRKTIATLLPFLGGGLGSALGYNVGDAFARSPGLELNDDDKEENPDAGDRADANAREERMEAEKQGSDGILSGLLGPSEEDKQRAEDKEKLDKAVARNMRERIARQIAKEKLGSDKEAAAGTAYLGSVLEKAAKRGLWDNVHAKRKRGEKPAKKGDKDYPDEKSWKKTTKEAIDAVQKARNAASKVHHDNTWKHNKQPILAQGPVLPGAGVDQLEGFSQLKRKTRNLGRKIPPPSNWNLTPQGLMGFLRGPRRDPEFAKESSDQAALKSLVLEKIAKSPAWQRKAGKNSEGGLNAKGRASYNKSTGGNLKAPVTEKKPKGKAKKRKASFCARMSGMKKKNTSKATANDPDSRINKSLRKWNC